MSGAESVLTSPERMAALLLLLAVAILAVSIVCRRVALIRSGRPVAAAPEGTGGALARFLLYVPGQWSNIRNLSIKDLAGIQHLMLFWGALFFFVYYALFFFVGDALGFASLLRGSALAQGFLGLTELFGVLLIVALIWGLARRTLLKPARLGPHFEGGLFAAITVAASALLICYFGLEALRFNLQTVSYTGPVSGLFADWLAALPSGTQAQLFHTAWWIQTAMLACFMVYVPYSDHQHAIFAPFNILASHPQPHGRFFPSGLQESYRGLAGPTDFTWKQMLEVYGCTQCGRCQEACPAATAGKALSPKKIIQHVRGSIDEAGKLVPFWHKAEAAGSVELQHRVCDEEVWSCTTCMACAEACPAFVSPLDKIVDLRRDRVMARSRFFPELTNLFRDLENFGDVFGKGKSRREDWTLGGDVRVLSEQGQADTLFWVGCQASFHDRHTKSAKSVAEVLAKGGVDMAIMGKGELCCGDPLRRLGNEYQYRNFVRKNIENLKKLHFKRIVTYCPHCYNTLKNEYPQFGGEFEVVHYTELLQDLIGSGSLKLKKQLPAKVAYHDPCYLARGNNLTKGREVLDALPGASTLDVERSGAKTFCCGGGGGAMWMRETGGAKINELRVRELVQDGPEVIATSCPYCVVMLEDGIRSLGVENVKCKDLIEMVRESV